MSDRIRLDDMTSDQLAALYARLEAAEAALERVRAALDTVDADTDGWQDFQIGASGRAYYRGMAELAERLREALDTTPKETTDA